MGRVDTERRARGRSVSPPHISDGENLTRTFCQRPESSKLEYELCVKSPVSTVEGDQVEVTP